MIIRELWDFMLPRLAFAALVAVALVCAFAIWLLSRHNVEMVGGPFPEETFKGTHP
jgi:hypothetical protein